MLSPIPPTPAIIGDHNNIFDSAFTESTEPMPSAKDEANRRRSNLDDVEIKSLDPIESLDPFDTGLSFRKMSTIPPPAAVPAH